MISVIFAYFSSSPSHPTSSEIQSSHLLDFFLDFQQAKLTFNLSLDIFYSSCINSFHLL